MVQKVRKDVNCDGYLEDLEKVKFIYTPQSRHNGPCKY